MNGRDEPKRTELGLSELLDELALLAVVAGVGGVVLHLLLDRVRVSWTFAPAIAVFAAPLALIDLRSGLLWIAMCAVASVTLRKWHARDLDRGGTEAQRRRERLGLRTSMRRVLTRERRGGSQRVGDRLVVGRNRSGELATVPFGERDGRRGLIVGAPGSGKTVSMAAVARGYIQAHLPVVCLDPKGDRSLGSALAQAAASSGKELHRWSHDGPATYNPVAQGSASEIADKVLAGEHWSEPHYLRQAQRYVANAVRVMREASAVQSLGALVELLNPDTLESQAGECGEELRHRVHAYLDSLSSRQRSDLGGVRDRLGVLVESDLGPYLEPTEAGEAIDLHRAWRSGDVVYMSLDADRFPLASEMLGAAILSDLVSLTGALQAERAAGLVCVDEFAAINSDSILRILSRSRSAGMSALVATQGLADLEEMRSEAGPEGVLRRVLSQVDFVLAHRQPEPQSAEVLAAMGGTKPAWMVTHRVDRRIGLGHQDATGTKSRGREFVRHPDEFKELGVGEAILIEPGSAKRASVVRVWAANDAPAKTTDRGRLFGRRGDARKDGIVRE